jgi:putative copper export protein
MFQSRWGRDWQLQLLAAVACTIAFGLPRRKATWILAAVTGLLLSLSEARTGHAAGSALRSVVQTVHLIGGGSWLGTLAALAFAERAASPALQQTLFRRFSLLAIAGASLLAASGLLACFFYVGTWSNLWMSAYGRLLILKIACFGGVLACGFANWKQVRRAAPSGRTVRLELGFTAAAIVLTGILTGVSHP